MASEAPADIVPNEGPQTDFLSCPADVAFFGGSRGGGKTYAMLMAAAMYSHVPRYSAVIFRRTAPELTGSGSVWEESQEMYRRLGGTPRTSPNLDWRFPSNAIIEMRHMQHESDRFAHQGKQYAYIGWEELGHFAEAQFWFMMGSLRSTCGVKPYVRATLNPDPDHFTRKMVDWWIGPDGYAIPERSGVIRYFVRSGDELHWFDTEEQALEVFPKQRPMSFTFIRASLDDNPHLLEKDPAYASRLDALPTVERERYARGNWNIKPAAGLVFRVAMFPIRELHPEEHLVLRRVRAWDFAATAPSKGRDPDWTIGVLLAELRDGRFVVEHVTRLRAAPSEVEATVLRMAELDGPMTEIAMWQDPGSAGVAMVDHMRGRLVGRQLRVVRASQSKLTYANTWASQAEGGRISVVRAAWNAPYLATLESFPDGRHDDDVDATSLAFQVFSSFAKSDFSFTRPLLRLVDDDDRPVQPRPPIPRPDTGGLIGGRSPSMRGRVGFV